MSAGRSRSTIALMVLGVALAVGMRCMDDGCQDLVMWCRQQYSTVSSKLSAGVHQASTPVPTPKAEPSNPSEVTASKQRSKEPERTDEQAEHARHLITSYETAACKLSGKVAGCGCDYASVERVNRDHLHPTLSHLVKTPYFKYFKVNLYCDCEFWSDSSMCFQKDCCVQECDASEIPESWKADDLKEQQQLESMCQGKAGVDRSLDTEVRDKLSSIEGWHGLNNPWLPEEDGKVEYIYVNMQLNPEKYTGYKGEDARRIWAAIYAQDCFTEVQQHQAGGGSGDVAHEKEVLYRLISGMHSSITTSIVMNFYNETSETWGPNLPFFKARFASPSSKPYVENLYFAYLFVLRAAMKAAPSLRALDYQTGSPEEDTRTVGLIHHLLGSRELQEACPAPFDESLLFKSKDSDELKKQLQVTFRNISSLMDCVGCEKCKMWGKLQMLGIASAMKVLFAVEEEKAVTLLRNEAIALVNLLGKLSESVETVRSLSVALDQQQAEQLQQQQAVGAKQQGQAEQQQQR